MKPFIFRLIISAVLFIPVSVLAQSLNQQIIPAKIQEVTVFINGAEITDSARVCLQKM